MNSEDAKMVSSDALSQATQAISNGGDEIIKGIVILLEEIDRYSRESRTGGRDCKKLLDSSLNYLLDEPYLALGVSPTADLATIKKSYRSKALLYHPDKNPCTSQLFTTILSAYDMLIDEEKRASFDARKRAQSLVFGHGRNFTKKGSDSMKTKTEESKTSEFGKWARPREIPKPRNLRAVEVTATSVTLEWSFDDHSAISAAFNLQWRKREIEVQPWNTTANPILSNTVRKKNLESSCYYEFKVRALLSTETSQFSEPLIVMTIETSENQKTGFRHQRCSSWAPDPDTECGNKKTPRAPVPPPDRPINGTGYNNRRKSTVNIQGSTNNKQLKFHWVRLIVIGSTGCGKTCLIHRYCSGQFRTKYIPTCGVDTFVKSADWNEIETRQIKVSFWDFSGYEEFESVRNEFYNEAQGIILLYDVSDRETFQSLNSWISEVEKYGGSEVPAILCGNKADKKPRVVREIEAKNWAIAKGYRYFETSALTGENVDIAMNNIIEQAAII